MMNKLKTSSRKTLEVAIGNSNPQLRNHIELIVWNNKDIGAYAKKGNCQESLQGGEAIDGVVKIKEESFNAFEIISCSCNAGVEIQKGHDSPESKGWPFVTKLGFSCHECQYCIKIPKINMSFG